MEAIAVSIDRRPRRTPSWVSLVLVRPTEDLVARLRPAFLDVPLRRARIAVLSATVALAGVVGLVTLLVTGDLGSAGLAAASVPVVNWIPLFMLLSCRSAADMLDCVCDVASLLDWLWPTAADRRRDAEIRREWFRQRHAELAAPAPRRVDTTTVRAPRSTRGRRRHRR